jgi:hypothetical protein
VNLLVSYYYEYNLSTSLLDTINLLLILCQFSINCVSIVYQFPTSHAREFKNGFKLVVKPSQAGCGFPS